MATIEQKIAQKEAELARLKMQARKLETSQKIIIGGMVLALAKKDTERAQMLVSDIKNNVTRDSDIKKLSKIIDELSRIIDSKKDDVFDNNTNNFMHNDDR